MPVLDSEDLEIIVCKNLNFDDFQVSAYVFYILILHI